MTNEMRREAEAAKPRCHKCHRTEGVADLVWCDKLGCDHHVCAECATATEWELEACCDEHAAAIAAQLRRTIYALRAEVRQMNEPGITIRRAA